MRRPSFCLDVRFGLSKLTSQLIKGEIACVFLLARNFTDAWLLGLNPLRFSRLRIDRGWAFPKSTNCEEVLRRYVRLGPQKPPKGGFCV